MELLSAEVGDVGTLGCAWRIGHCVFTVIFTVFAVVFTFEALQDLVSTNNELVGPMKLTWDDKRKVKDGALGMRLLRFGSLQGNCFFCFLYPLKI
jgi:hypothetical protein